MPPVPCQFLLRKSGPDSKKYKGIKAGSKKISFSATTFIFGHDLQMGDALDIANRVLVGQVQGRTYTATRHRQWILEIWGQVLEVLPGVVTLSRGWFALHFQRPEYIPWVLSYLRDGAPYLTRNLCILALALYGFVCLVFHYISGLRMFLNALEMLWVLIWTMTNRIWLWLVSWLIWISTKVWWKTFKFSGGTPVASRFSIMKFPKDVAGAIKFGPGTIIVRCVLPVLLLYLSPITLQWTFHRDHRIRGLQRPLGTLQRHLPRCMDRARNLSALHHLASPDHAQPLLPSIQGAQPAF